MTNIDHLWFRQSVENQVKTITAHQLGVDEANIIDESKFIDDLGADSLDIVELAMEFDAVFNLEIPDEDMAKLTTVSDMVAYIVEKTSG